MERVVRERMASQDPDDIALIPSSIFAPLWRPSKFFGSFLSCLSLWINQTLWLVSPTSAVCQRLVREALRVAKSGSSRRTNVPTAVRDVHNSHYSYVPHRAFEASNIGLIGSLALYARQ